MQMEAVRKCAEMGFGVWRSLYMIKDLRIKTHISIESFGKVKYLDLTLGADGKVTLVRVNMGGAYFGGKGGSGVFG